MASIFSRIAQGEVSCHKVWEDDRFLAFLDIRPMAPGHTLVIPKRKMDYIFDLPEEEHAALWSAARTVARKLQAALGCARICVGVWGYEVPHVHIHLVPTNDMKDFPPPPWKPASDDELAAMAARLNR